MTSILGERSIGIKRGYDVADLDAIDEMRVARRFPVGAFLWSVGGLLVAGFLAAVVVNAKLNSPSRNFPNMGYAYFFAFAALAGTVYYLPTVLAFLLAPRPFVIGRDGFHYGRRQLRFEQIRGLQNDVGRSSTRLLLDKGPSIRLRWPIWRDSGLFVNLLEHRCQPHLLSAAIAQLQAGKRVWFGSKLALDRKTVQIKGKVLPLEAVTDFHFTSQSERGDETSMLRLRTLKREYLLDERHITNAKVFVGAFKHLSELRDDDGISHGCPGENRPRTGIRNAIDNITGRSP
ncbi:hypothetical protein [Agrobacterium sp. NPDC089420]|uniref:hypothetical protein n=1 Tax=Agrobacterium sp. NPDC089420 TaxID=3363918 RepID=UPI00384C6FD3